MRRHGNSRNNYRTYMGRRAIGAMDPTADDQ